MAVKNCDFPKSSLLNRVRKMAKCRAGGMRWMSYSVWKMGSVTWTNQNGKQNAGAYIVSQVILDEDFFSC
jgi:hypothetical protein